MKLWLGKIKLLLMLSLAIAMVGMIKDISYPSGLFYLEDQSQLDTFDQISISVDQGMGLISGHVVAEGTIPDESDVAKSKNIKTQASDFYKEPSKEKTGYSYHATYDNIEDIAPVFCSGNVNLRVGRSVQFRLDSYNKYTDIVEDIHGKISTEIDEKEGIVRFLANEEGTFSIIISIKDINADLRTCLIKARVS